MIRLAYALPPHVLVEALETHANKSRLTNCWTDPELQSFGKHMHDEMPSCPSPLALCKRRPPNHSKASNSWIVHMILAVYRYPLVQTGVQKCTSQWAQLIILKSMTPQHPWRYMSNQPLIMATQD